MRSSVGASRLSVSTAARFTAARTCSCIRRPLVRTIRSGALIARSPCRARPWASTRSTAPTGRSSAKAVGSWWAHTELATAEKIDNKLIEQRPLPPPPPLGTTPLIRCGHLLRSHFHVSLHHLVLYGTRSTNLWKKNKIKYFSLNVVFA